MARMTKTERMAREGLMRNLIYLMQEEWIPATITEEIPAAWHTLEMDLDVEEEREKVTLYLDRSVARFYRGMGKGYHKRINRLLATYAQMRIAEVYKQERFARSRKEALGIRLPGE